MSAMVPLETALQKLVDLATPLPAEQTAIEACDGLVLAQTCTARRTQPPFDVSAMDGYALTRAPVSGEQYIVVGEVPAGAAYDGALGQGEAVRIFTGARVPDGASHIVIQEDVTTDQSDGTRTLTIKDDAGQSANIRPAGNDFAKGDVLVSAGTRLTPQTLGLLAAANHWALPCVPKPTIDILMTGDELVLPSQEASQEAIIASNGYAIAALARRMGATVNTVALLGDDAPNITQWCTQTEADIVLTIGGASVGDYDLVRPALQASGFALDVIKVALRPGKPTFFGKRDDQIVLGLPGNPVSSLVSAQLFLAPLIAKRSGRAISQLISLEDATLATELPANGPRAHFMRAVMDENGDVTPIATQDSSLLSRLSAANVLLYRAIDAPPAAKGSPCQVLRLPT